MCGRLGDNDGDGVVRNSKFRDASMRWRSTMIRVQRIKMVHARTLPL